MSHPKRGLKALGLSLLAALGLMAFMAAGAQANWLVSGLGELKANESVSAKAHTTGVLTVPNKNLEIQCTTLAASNLKLLASSATAEGEVKFSSCTTFSPIKSGKAQGNCKPTEPITAGGLALVVLHSGKNYVLFEPKGGGAFTTVEFSELCSLTETSEVTGSLVAECGHLSGGFAGLDCATLQTEPLITPAAAALFPGDTLNFGENSAGLTGIASVALSGGNVGKGFGGHI